MFVAVRPSQAVTDDLEDFLHPRRTAFHVRWTRPADWHLTLAFLPDVPDQATDDLLDGLAQAADRHDPATLALTEGGVFGEPFAAKVLWTKPAGDDLSPLAAACRRAANRSGLDVDGGRFIPHLTIARTRFPIDATDWFRLMDTYTGPTWTATDIELIASHRGAHGRHYETLAQVALGG